jgi:PD-(D/E)XK endonuclease
MLSTNQRGAIAEQQIISAALELGIGVFRALMDERYDLIFDVRPQLLRVQCKTAVLNGEVIVVRCYSCRRSPAGLLKRCYTKDEIDGVAAYCAELMSCYFIPAARISGRSTIQLRLQPAQNNQRVGINWANDFEFAATLTPTRGAIAQLGERLRGTQEVAGSSPAGSTLF